MKIEEYLNEIEVLNIKKEEINNQIKKLEQEKNALEKEIGNMGDKTINVKFGDLIEEIGKEGEILKADYRFSCPEIQADEKTFQDEKDILKKWFEDNVFIIAKIVGIDYNLTVRVPVSNAQLTNGSALMSKVNMKHDKKNSVLFEFEDLKDLELPIPLSKLSGASEIENKDAFIRALNRCSEKGLTNFENNNDDEQEL